MRPRRHHHSLLPPGLSIERIEIGGTEIVAVARTRLTIPECPACGRTSTQIHSRYRRCLADLPTHGLRVRISLEVRRFRCGPELPENDIRRAVRRRDHAIVCAPHLTAAERRPPSRSRPWRSPRAKPRPAALVSGQQGHVAAGVCRDRPRPLLASWRSSIADISRTAALRGAGEWDCEWESSAPCCL